MNKRTLLLLLLFSIALAFYSQNAFADGSYACSYSGDCSDTGTSPFSGSGCYPSDLTGTYTAICKLGVTYSCSYCSNGCSSGACNPAPAPTPTPACTPSCSGDQCGQSNGCGGTCPSTDASTPGKCGNPAPNPCAGVTCNTPPSATCSGSNKVTYSSSGTCSNGQCSYSSSSAYCTYGCSGSSCNPAPAPTPTTPAPAPSKPLAQPSTAVCGNSATESGEDCDDGSSTTSGTRYCSTSILTYDACVNCKSQPAPECPAQTPPTPTCIDNDGDGYGQNCAKGADCNDNNAKVNRGAAEVCGNGIDEDCSGGDATCPAPKCTPNDEVSRSCSGCKTATLTMCNSDGTATYKLPNQFDESCTSDCPAPQVKCTPSAWSCTLPPAECPSSGIKTSTCTLTDTTCTNPEAAKPATTQTCTPQVPCGSENQKCCTANTCNTGLNCIENKVGYTVISAVCKKPAQQIIPICIDKDADGYFNNAVECGEGATKQDCNDNSAAVNPAALEAACDSDNIDNNCDGVDAPACAIGGGSSGGVSASCDSSTAVDLYVDIASAVIENDQVKIAFLTPSKSPVNGGCALRFKVGIMLNNNLVDTMSVEVPNPAAQFRYSFAVSKLQKGSNNLRIIADYYKTINDIDRSNNEDSTTISYAPEPTCGDNTCNGPETTASCPADCKELRSDLGINVAIYTSYPGITERVIRKVGEDVTLMLEITNFGSKEAVDYNYEYECGNGKGGRGTVPSGTGKKILPREKATGGVSCVYTQIGLFNVTVSTSTADDINELNNNNFSELYVVNPDENSAINKGGYFVLGNSYLMQYVGADAITATSAFTRFKNVATGEILEVAAGSVAGSIKIGGATYVFTSKTDPEYADYDIIVDLNGDGKLGKIGEATDVTSCTDSDGGREYYTKGFVSTPTQGRGLGQFHDKCVVQITDPQQGYYAFVDGKYYNYKINYDNDQCEGEECYVAEAYCKESSSDSLQLPTKSFAVYKCPNGCKDGACLQIAEKPVVVFTVNGEPTPEFSEGGIFSLADGTSIGIFNIIAERFAGGVREVEFFFGAVRDVLSEGELDNGKPKSYTVSGKTYDVVLDFVGSTTASFTVNGQPAKLIPEGSTYTLSDGSQIGVKKITAENFAGGVRNAEFFLGAVKGVLREGKSGIYTVNGKSYEIEASFIGSEDEKAQTIPKDVTLVCPSRINVSFDKDTYRAGDTMTLTIKVYDEKGKLVSADLNAYTEIDGVPSQKYAATIPSSGLVGTEKITVDDGKIHTYMLILGESDDCAAIGRYISATASIRVLPSSVYAKAGVSEAKEGSNEIVKIISGSKQAPPAPPSPPTLPSESQAAAQGGVGDVFAAVSKLIDNLFGFIYS